MIVSRKQRLFIGFILVAGLMIPALAAFAGTVHYTYDARSQVTRAEYGDGTVIEYTYDTMAAPDIHTIQPTFSASGVVLEFRVESLRSEGSAIPEPSSLLVIGIGLLGLLGIKFLSRKA